MKEDHTLSTCFRIDLINSRRSIYLSLSNFHCKNYPPSIPTSFLLHILYVIVQKHYDSHLNDLIDYNFTLFYQPREFIKEGEKKKERSLTWWRSIDRLCLARPKLPGSKGRTRTAWAPCSRRPRTRCAIPRCIHPRGRTRCHPLLARCSRCSRLRPRCSRCWHVRSVDRSRAAPRKSCLSGEGGGGVCMHVHNPTGLITAEIVIRHDSPRLLSGAAHLPGQICATGEIMRDTCPATITTRARNLRFSRLLAPLCYAYARRCVRVCMWATLEEEFGWAESYYRYLDQCKIYMCESMFVGREEIRRVYWKNVEEWKRVVKISLEIFRK